MLTAVLHSEDFHRGHGKTMDFRVTHDMYHMTVVRFSTLANGHNNNNNRKASASQTLQLEISRADA